MTIDEINQQVEAEKRLAENIEKVGAKIADETALAPEDSSDQDVQMMDADYDAAPSAAPVPAKEPTQKCTVCGKLIPVSEIENHVRVELLDPKWREQRLAARAKGGDHTMASAEEMATNLRDFVRARKRPFAMPSQQTAEEKAVFGEKQAVLGEEKSAVQTSAMPAAVMPSVAASNSLVTVMAPAMSITSAPPVGIGMPPPQSHLGPGAGLIPQPPLFGIMQPLQQPPFNSFDAAGMMHPSQQPFLGSAAGQMPLQPPFGLDVGLMQPTLQPEMAMALPQPPLGRVAAVMSRGSMTTSEMTGMAEKNNLMPEEQYLRTHSVGF